MKKRTAVKLAHTPGPWFHIPRARDGHCDLVSIREGRADAAFIQIGSPVCERPILDYPHDNVQTANARLVAAAPELLEACRLLMKGEPMQQGERNGYIMGALSTAIDAARAAIAKAEGPNP